VICTNFNYYKSQNKLYITIVINQCSIIFLCIRNLYALGRKYLVRTIENLNCKRVFLLFEKSIIRIITSHN